ncbi:hypothetical protein AVEN_163948-1 [Araneus ventricosus]|uniref:Uncharacterized protein n=1 Tax=Araneus ventricosus TaxID=182803 RepID=A0A4Y2GZC8_ARAVE|nr:hypothetical protein AVEN_163948-1 [Araneus ventricosus]
MNHNGTLVYHPVLKLHEGYLRTRHSEPLADHTKMRNSLSKLQQYISGRVSESNGFNFYKALISGGFGVESRLEFAILLFISRDFAAKQWPLQIVLGKTMLRWFSYSRPLTPV